MTIFPLIFLKKYISEHTEYLTDKNVFNYSKIKNLIKKLHLKSPIPIDFCNSIVIFCNFALKEKY